MLQAIFGKASVLLTTMYRLSQVGWNFCLKWRRERWSLSKCKCSEIILAR
jgi:hypothetical protein